MMRNQRQVALAHSGVKLTGPAEGYGRKKELQVRQWLTSLPAAATSDVAAPSNEDQSCVDNFEELPPLVQDLYRQLTDSTDGFPPPALDDAPTYPNSNIPRRATSPNIASTPTAPRGQSRVPLPPDCSQPPTPIAAADKLQQQQSPLKRNLESLNSTFLPVASSATGDICVESPLQSAASSRLKNSAIPAASSFVVSVSTLDPVSEHGSALQSSVARQTSDAANQANLELLLRTLDVCPSARPNLQNAAEEFIRQANAQVETKDMVLYAALLQAVSAHEQYKDQVRHELEQARRTAANASATAEEASEEIRRRLKAESARAERAEQSLQELQAAALQEKKKVQTLRMELEEERNKNTRVSHELELATQQLQKSTAAQADSVKQLEARLQQAKQEAKQAADRAAAAQKHEVLVQKRLEAQVTSLESQLQACTNNVSELNQEQAKLKGQLAAETRARAAAEQAEKAALRSLQEQAEVTAAMQQTMANSWLLQHRQTSSAARLAALTQGSGVSSDGVLADPKKIEAAGARLERSMSANTATAVPSRAESKDLGSTSTPSRSSRTGISRKADLGQGAGDSPRQADDSTQRQSVNMKPGSSSRERRLSNSINSNDNTLSAKESPTGRQLLRSATSERRLLLEAQKAERRAAANAMLEESKLQEVALEGAPAHLRHLGVAFRACLLASDNASQAIAQSLADKLSTGYRMFVDPLSASSSSDNADKPWTCQANPLIPLCQAVIWLASPDVPGHICDQLAQACTHGRQLIILAQHDMDSAVRFHPPWLAANSSTASAAGTSADAVMAYVCQAWEERITMDGTDDIKLDNTLRQVALRLGVCDDVLSLLPSAVLKRASKSLQPDLLHLNLPGLAHLNLEGNSMTQLTCGSLDPNNAPALSFGSCPAADLCYALQHNSTIKLVTVASLSAEVLQAVARAVCGAGCGVVTLHTHNDLPVAALMGRAPPCTELAFTRPLSAEDTTALSILLPACTSPPSSISIPVDTSLPSAAATTLCATVCALPNVQKLNDLDLRSLESMASGCSASCPAVLDLGGRVLGPTGAQILMQRLAPHMKRLENAARLNATACQLSPGGLQQLLTLLQPACSNGKMQVLCLADNKCGPEGVAHLAQVARTPVTSLAVLDLSMNCLGNEGASQLAALLPNMPSLRCLGLGHNTISSDGLKSLCSTLTSLSQLQELQLGGNLLGDEGMAALASSLRSLPKLEVLSLQDNYNLGVETARCLGSALPSCSSLRQLNLAKAHLGPEGARHLATGVANAPALTTLNLELCKLRAAGAAALAGPVSSAQRLEELIIARNGIGDAGASALAQALSKSSCLTRLDLRNNGIGQLGGAALKALITRPKCTITAISLGGNREDANLGSLEDLAASMASGPGEQQGAPTSRMSRGQGPSQPQPQSTGLPNSSRLQSPDPNADKSGKLVSKRPSPTTAPKPDPVTAKQLPASSLMAQWRTPQPASLTPPEGMLTDKSTSKFRGLGDAGGCNAEKLAESKLLGARVVGNVQPQVDLIAAARDECETSSDSLEAALERYRKR